MNKIYELTDKIRESVANNSITNAVTFGDLLEVDLDKTTMFPLAHVVVGDVVFEDKIYTVNVNVLFLDIVDYNKESSDEDFFYGNNNLQDVLNTQFELGNILRSQMVKGSFNDLNMFVVEETTAEPFLDNFENQLAGWSFTYPIQVANNNLITPSDDGTPINSNCS